MCQAHMAQELGAEEPAARRPAFSSSWEVEELSAKRPRAEQLSAERPRAEGLSAELRGFSAKELVGSGANGLVFKVVDTSGETFALKSPKSSEFRRTCSSPSCVSRSGSSSSSSSSPSSSPSSSSGSSSRPRSCSASGCSLGCGAEGFEVLESFEAFEKLSKLRHENVVELHGSAADGSIVMEFVDGESLEELLSSRSSGLEEEEVQRVLGQVLSGLSFLHQRSVVHTDLKPANVLLDKRSGQAKIVDLPCSSSSSSSSSSRLLQRGGVAVPQGTPAFMAPETVRTGAHSAASDVWSFGCLALNLLTGRLPWAEEDSSFSAMFKIGHGQHPQLPASLSPAARAFLLRCFEPKAELRALPLDLLNDPFLASQPLSPSSASSSAAASSCSSSASSRAEEVAFSPLSTHHSATPGLREDAKRAWSVLRARGLINKRCGAKELRFRQRVLAKGLVLRPLAVL